MEVARFDVRALNMAMWPRKEGSPERRGYVDRYERARSQTQVACQAQEMRWQKECAGKGQTVRVGTE